MGQPVDVPLNPEAVPDIDLTAKPGDVTYKCPTCGWQVTLKPEGDQLWTQNGTITPRCANDSVDLVRTVKE